MPHPDVPAESLEDLDTEEEGVVFDEDTLDVSYLATEPVLLDHDDMDDTPVVASEEGEDEEATDDDFPEEDPA